MTTTGFFAGFQLAALATLAGLAIGRATVLYARGVHVVAADPQRSLMQGLVDFLSVVFFFWWAYEAVAYSWPRSSAVGPGLLGTVLVDSVVIKLAGALMVLAGLVIFALALWSFADSWRVGVDRTTPGALMTGGIFAWTRNPIYVGLDLIVCGTALLQGRTIFVLLASALIVLLHYHVRREEHYLASAYGDAYRRYRTRVGRYGTWC
jgi:protein-S-isoprenylcysteine O-methyltransferase Ste14